jgi:hypothetical protein
VSLHYNNYAKLKDIDQRLINPDRSNDSKHAFDRTKVFGHGKAAYCLSKLREKIGDKPFDDAVKEYLSKCRECSGGYQDFKKFLAGYRDRISEFEKLHQVL